MPGVLAVLVFTVSWFQMVGAPTEKARDETEVWHMVDVEDELWTNVMSWWTGIPVTDHVVCSNVFLWYHLCAVFLLNCVWC